MKDFKTIIYLLISLFITSCEISVEKYQDDYFVYKKHLSAVDENGDFVYHLVGLTELGKQQRILILPEMYKNRKVLLSSGLANEGFAKIGSTEAEKIFLPYTIDSWEYSFFTFTKEEHKIITITNTPNYDEYTYRGDMYVSSYLYDNSDEYLKSLGQNTNFIIERCKKANVSYHFNYENSPNIGYYWIDDYNYGEIISFIPNNPIREEYTFGGWYKEPECINKWDFSLDKLPEGIVDNSDNLIYQETTLYAKWVKETEG